jgi:hypothetical protein
MLASSFAVANPIPEVLPHTQAVLFLREKIEVIERGNVVKQKDFLGFAEETANI